MDEEKMDAEKTFNEFYKFPSWTDKVKDNDESNSLIC